MNALLAAGGQSVLILILIFWFFFVAASLAEGQGRAVRRSIGVLGLIAGINVLLYSLPERAGNWGFGLVLALTAAVLLFFLLSPRPRRALEIVGRPRRIDERDVIFARFDLRPGSPGFIEYYGRRPQYEEKDASIRKIPDVLSAPHQKKSPLLFSLASAEFDFLEHLLSRVIGEEEASTALSVNLSPRQNSAFLKDIVRYLGADDCGITPLNPDFVYSHVGRGPEPHGSEIVLEHRFAVAFAVEMDTAMVAAAPDAPVIVETGKQYVEAARIAIVLADFLRRLGYPARAHIAGSNYQVMLPPIAWEAGLRELGRLGVLITSKHGPRARLGLVTTDFPLEPDRPTVFGAQDFCSRCLKCALNCPARAIPSGDRTLENGIRRWVIDRERCYEFWRRTGTDCAVCLAVCPYSHPASPFHRLIRGAASVSRPLQSVFSWADRFFYGEGLHRRQRGWTGRLPGPNS
jgi:reductive dehalogenase